MTTVHVGLPALRGTLEEYANHFDLLEVCPLDQPLPKPSKLRSWRREVPPTFAFSVVLPSIVSSLKPSAAADDALARSLETAKTLQARCIVLVTPPDVTPTPLNRKRLAELVAKLPKDVVFLGWEPRGVWDLDEADALARQLGLSIIVDATRDLPRKGNIVYTRLRGIGGATRLSAPAIERARQGLAGRREVFVVVESGSPTKVAQALRDLPDAPAKGVTSIASPMRFSADDEEQ